MCGIFTTPRHAPKAPYNPPTPPSRCSFIRATPPYDQIPLGARKPVEPLIGEVPVTDR